MACGCKKTLSNTHTFLALSKLNHFERITMGTFFEREREPEKRGKGGKEGEEEGGRRERERTRER